MCKIYTNLYKRKTPFKHILLEENLLQKNKKKIMKQKTNAIFYNKIRQDVKVLTNINIILEKVEEDGFLSDIHKNFLKILDNEFLYSLKELLKIEKNETHFDMRTQLTNNTFIFKENLKKITEFISCLKSRSNLEREDKRRCVK
jgi:hypothetical protein